MLLMEDSEDKKKQSERQMGREDEYVLWAR